MNGLRYSATLADRDMVSSSRSYRFKGANHDRICHFSPLLITRFLGMYLSVAVTTLATLIAVYEHASL